MIALMPCTCGRLPLVEDIALGGQPGPFSIHCPHCFDGDPRDCSSSVKSLDEAAWWWNERIEERTEKKAEARHVTA